MVVDSETIQGQLDVFWSRYLDKQECRSGESSCFLLEVEVQPTIEIKDLGFSRFKTELKKNY